MTLLFPILAQKVNTIFLGYKDRNYSVEKGERERDREREREREIRRIVGRGNLIYH